MGVGHGGSRVVGFWVCEGWGVLFLFASVAGWDRGWGWWGGGGGWVWWVLARGVTVWGGLRRGWCFCWVGVWVLACGWGALIRGPCDGVRLPSGARQESAQRMRRQRVAGRECGDGPDGAMMECLALRLQARMRSIYCPPCSWFSATV